MCKTNDIIFTTVVALACINNIYIYIYVRIHIYNIYICMYICTYINIILLHTCIYIHTYVYNNLYISNSHIIYIGVRASVTSIKFHPISAIMAWAPGMLVNSFTSIWNLRPLVSKGLRSALMRQSFRLSSRDGPKSMLALAQVSILKSGKRYLFIWNVGDSHRPSVWIWPCSLVMNCRLSEGTVHDETLPHSFQ